MTIKVKDLGSASRGKELVFEGHTAPILSVSLDPKSEFLVNRLQLFHYTKSINKCYYNSRLRVVVTELYASGL